MIITNATIQALRTTFSKLFQNGLGRAATVTGPFVTEVPSTTLVATYGFLGDFPIFKQWIGQKQAKALQEKVYQLQNDDFEVTLTIHKNKIEDDNLGLYPNMMEGIGQDAGYLKDRLCLAALMNGTSALCYDGQNYFDTDHVINGVTFANNDTTATAEPIYFMDLSKPLKPILYQNRKAPFFLTNINAEGTNDHLFNTGEYKFGGEARGAAGYTYWQLAYRSTQPLTAATWVAIRTWANSLTTDNGTPLGIKFTHVVTGASQLSACKQLFEAQNEAGGASNIYWKEVTVIDASAQLP